VWDMETGAQVLCPLEGHTWFVYSVAISPDGHHIASGSWDNTVRVWDMETGKQVFGPLEGHSDDVNSVVFSPDGRCVISGSHDKTIRVWDLAAASDMNSQNTRVEDESAAVADRRFLKLDLRSYSSKVPDKDGWLKGPDGQLVLWLPEEYRADFKMPPCITIVGGSEVAVDLRNWSVHGSEWTKCYQPRSR